MRLRTIAAAVVGAVVGFLLSVGAVKDPIPTQARKRIYANRINELRQAYIVGPEDIVVGSETDSLAGREGQYRSVSWDTDVFGGDGDE